MTRLPAMNGRHHRSRHQRCLAPAIAAVALAVLTASAAAETRPESAPAAFVGQGAHTGGGYGLQAAYYQRLGRRPWYLVPQLGGGYRVVPYGPDGWMSSTGFGWSAGLMVVRGDAHRVLLSADYGVMEAVKRELHGTHLWWKPMAGLHLGLGYERNHRHWLLRFIPGVFFPTGVLPPEHKRPRFAFTFSAGWKLW